MAFQQLSYFLENSNQLTNEIFGFRKGITKGAVANFSEEVYCDFDGPQCTMGVFCDIFKAFDCVIHKIVNSVLMSNSTIRDGNEILLNSLIA